MNIYTRREKIAMAIEDIVEKAKMAFEVTLITAGIVALIAIGFMTKKIEVLEDQIEEYEMQMEEMKESSGDWIVVRDGLTGEVIYSGLR